MALPTPGFWTVGFQPCEGVDVCRFKLPGLWYLVLAALADQEIVTRLSFFEGRDGLP